MKKLSLSSAPRVPFDLEGYIMHSSLTLEVIHLILQPGQVVSQHSSPFNVVVSLIEGEAALIMSTNETRLTLYDVVEIEMNSDRGFINSGTTISRLLIPKKLH